MAGMRSRYLSSGELARHAGLNPETLRYYERRGLLPRPARTESGHRRYAPEAASLLRLIKRAQDLGFTLAEVGGMLREMGRPRAVCDDVCQVIRTKIGQVDREIARLRIQRARLMKLQASCPSRRPLRECPVVVELQKPKRR